MTLPGRPKPPGNGMNPTPFGWDRTDYMLGYLNVEAIPPEDQDTKLSRCSKAHESFKKFYLSREKSIGNSDYSAFCRFLEWWKPDKAIDYPVLPELSSGFGVVRFEGETPRFLHEIPAIQHETKNDKAWISRCLVSGDITEIAQTHKIKTKGVMGALGQGALLVSFNKDAFCSYRKEQSHNAPIGEKASFEFSTALNSLLESDSQRRIQFGDATCIFWADENCLAEDLFHFNLTNIPAEDFTKVQKLRGHLASMASGMVHTEEIGHGGFYVLALSPNSGRLSVRFWYQGTVEEMIGRVSRHQKELAIVKGSKDREYLPLWTILNETARESKDIQPLLGGTLMRSILTGTRYPTSLLSTIIRRIRVDDPKSKTKVNHAKAAIIKAILIRNYGKEELYMLDENRSEVAYQLGRLFASLERTQENALGNINASIKDRYYGSASSTPAAVFPRLVRMSQHHIGKLTGGMKVAAEKRIQEICGRIHDFPNHMNLADQGLFALGYYHQRQDFFVSKTNPSEKDGKNE